MKKAVMLFSFAALSRIDNISHENNTDKRVYCTYNIEVYVRANYAKRLLLYNKVNQRQKGNSSVSLFCHVYLKSLFTSLVPRYDCFVFLLFFLDLKVVFDCLFIGSS